MANLNGFDANDVDPATEFEPLPQGKYLVVIIDSEMKPTKSGSGHYLELTFQVVNGPYANRLLWSRLNLDNPSMQAVEIARGELSAICRAVGVMTPRDSVELHDLPLVVTVVQKRRDDNGEIVNEIRGYMKKEPAKLDQAQQEMTSAPPWARS